MACGIHKPHVPYLAPDKYFEMYPKAGLVIEPASLAFWDTGPKIAQTNRHKAFGFEFGVGNDALRRNHIQAFTLPSGCTIRTPRGKLGADAE